jgi:hypothetical protein
VRLESKTQYGPGLFLFDVKHAPYGCATWPALWLAELVSPLLSSPSLFLSLSVPIVIIPPGSLI